MYSHRYVLLQNIGKKPDKQTTLRGEKQKTMKKNIKDNQKNRTKINKKIPDI